MYITVQFFTSIRRFREGLYCCLQCTVVLVGVVLKGSLLFDGCIMSIPVVVFSKATI